VLVALLAGGKLLGLVGALVSAPVAAVLGVLARSALERYHASPLYGPPPAAPPCRRKPDEWPS